MSFYSNDLSGINAEDEKGFIKVYRRPVIFIAKTEGSFAKLYKIKEGKIDAQKEPLKIPVSLFKSAFINWPESGGGGTYCRKPNPSHAVKIESRFHIDILSCDDEFSTKRGQPGDYLITKESGENEICKKCDFEQMFISSIDWERSTEQNNDTLSI